MKQFLPILVLVCLGLVLGSSEQPRERRGSGGATGFARRRPRPRPRSPADQENARKAKAILDQAIQALGGQSYLTIRDREQQGRGYSFHHGRPSGAGARVLEFHRVP